MTAHSVKHYTRMWVYGTAHGFGIQNLVPSFKLLLFIFGL